MSKHHEHEFALFHKQAYPNVRQKLDRRTMATIGAYALKVEDQALSGKCLPEACSLKEKGAKV